LNNCQQPSRSLDQLNVSVILKDGLPQAVYSNTDLAILIFSADVLAEISTCHQLIFSVVRRQAFAAKMRLLHTDTLEFAEFFEPDIPDYAILSHRWGKEEVTLQEVRDRLNRHKAGCDKVRRWCELGTKRGFQWVWIDTCCL
jgi:hypothetical protein